MRWVLLLYSLTCIGLTIWNCVILIDWESQKLAITYTILLLGGYVIMLKIYVH